MSTQNISITTELMKNYKQAELMSPEKEFEALQTGTGCSLLFSIGTDGIFYVTKEDVGCDTGWSKTDLSSDQIKVSFPGESGLTCKTFGAVQNAVDGTIGIAMVLSGTAGDHLFLCLGNPDLNIGWLNSPAWVQYPFDNPMKDVVIASVFLSETKDASQFIVADVLRDPSSIDKLISRYYIDTQRSNGHAWHVHDVAIDLEAGNYTSCLGRQYLPNSPHQPLIDGLYTCGRIGGNAQFTFQPLYNVFDRQAPVAPARLRLPDATLPDSMATCRKPDMSTDLYVCGNGSLFYFENCNQSDGATAVLLSSNRAYRGVTKMYAHQLRDTVIVWGINGGDEIFYTSCTIGQETAQPSAWSYPLPIVAGVDMFSPYINRQDEGNTFFALAGNTMQKLIKSPLTSIWQSQYITLPSPITKNTQKYSSYTTMVRVTDQNMQPLAATPVTIAAAARTGVYINHLYYVLDGTGVPIDTDQFGNITIVEWVTGLTGTTLTVTGNDDNPFTQNPMDGPMRKIASLNTKENLQGATITNMDGSTRPLINNSVQVEDLQTVATANGNLCKAYDSISTKGSSAGRLVKEPKTAVQGALIRTGTNAIMVEAGDLYSWLASKVEAMVEIVKEVGSNAWHFVATIAGEAYAAELDSAEKVVGAVEWVFSRLKIAIGDLIEFLEFLFGWHDILVTHKVMKNLFLQFTQLSIDRMADIKTDIVKAFASLQADVNKWADIPNIGQTPGSTTGSHKPLAGQDGAPANLGIHHFQGNAANSSSASFTPLSIVGNIFDDLKTLLDSEDTTLMNAYESIKIDIIDQFPSLTVTEIITKFIAIATDTLLQTAGNILSAVADVFLQLLEGIISALTTSIDIPVISFLYKEMSGGEDLSFIDVICLLGAIPATVIYKIATGKAPFPQGDGFTESLLVAKDFNAIQASFAIDGTAGKPAHMGKMAIAAAVPASPGGPVPVLDQDRLKKFSFVTGFFAFAGCRALVIVSSIQRATEVSPQQTTNPFPKVLALVGAVSNIAYISPNISAMINTQIDDWTDWYVKMNSFLSCLSVIKGFVNIRFTYLTGPLALISPTIETIMNFTWNVPVIMNLIYNIGDLDGTYKSLVPESIGNTAFNLGGMMELPIYVIKNVKAKIITSTVQFGLMNIYGLCMPIAGGIYEFMDGQDH